MTTNISSYNLSERQVQLDLSVLPYDFEENVKTLSEQARQAWNDVQDLEASACPDNKAQITITMHPSFASQIYFPEEFLLVMGLDCVGVRQVQCFPRDTSSCDTEDGEITVAARLRRKETGHPGHSRQTGKSCLRHTRRKTDSNH